MNYLHSGGTGWRYEASSACSRSCTGTWCRPTDTGRHRPRARRRGGRIRRHRDAEALRPRGARARRPRRSRRHPPRDREWKPHIAFNLLEAFDDVTIFDQNVVSYLELLKLPYTGCNPRGLLLARDKSLSKKLLAYHRIPVPEFVVFRVGRKAIRRPQAPAVPADREVADAGSVDRHLAGVGRRTTTRSCRKRVEFIHDSIGTAAIVERYIDGRELYVGILGNERLQRLSGLGDVLRRRCPRATTGRSRPTA